MADLDHCGEQLQVLLAEARARMPHPSMQHFTPYWTNLVDDLSYHVDRLLAATLVLRENVDRRKR